MNENITIEDVRKIIHNYINFKEEGYCIECDGIDPPLCVECFLELIKSGDIVIEKVE